MPTSGIGDPYWFEWYVGLKNVIEMINPDSGIDCVIFQHPSYDAIDDVVVEYKSGAKQICYQVKHEIATSAQHNLTFGKLIGRDSNDKCLLAELFSGWQKASVSGEVTITPVLFTNRQIGTRRSTRTFNGKKYSAYPIDTFLSLLKEQLATNADCSGSSWEDINLANQWKEMYAAIGITNAAESVPFIKTLSVQANQMGLAEMERSLILSLAGAFSWCEWRYRTF